MAKIIDNDYMVCEDCIQPIINDDWTGLDYHYKEEEANYTAEDITVLYFQTNE